MNQVLVLGRRRQGKSTLSVALGLASHNSVVIFDPNHQHSQWTQVTPEELPSYFMDPDTQGQPQILVFQPTGDIQQEFTRLAEVLCGTRWDWSDYSLILDEVSTLQHSNWIHPDLERFIRQAPEDITVISNTHRVVDVHRLLREQASDTFIFRLTLEPDLKVVAAHWGEEVANVVRVLPQFHVVHRWQTWGGEDGLEVWTDPEVWNVSEVTEVTAEPKGTDEGTSEDRVLAEVRKVRRSVAQLRRRLKETPRQPANVPESTATPEPVIVVRETCSARMYNFLFHRRSNANDKS